MKGKTSHGKNTGAVTAKIRQGGNQAGGSRRGPSAPPMRKNPYAQKGGK